jgi:hypothetical protein
MDSLLPFWFLLWDIVGLGLLSANSYVAAIGLDFRIYRAAASALLSGTSPWSAFVHFGSDFHFAALPTDAQVFIPFALVPFELGLSIWTTLSLGLTIAALRRLELPIWWLLFPPIIDGLLAGNPHLVAFALVALAIPRPAPGAKHDWHRGVSALAGALAATLKIYATLPLVAHRCGIALGAILLAVGASALVAPSLWAQYISEFGFIGSRLISESHGGTSVAVVLSPTLALSPLAGIAIYVAAFLLLLAVATRNVTAAGWIAVPLLWPAAETHYATFTLPIARRLSTWVIAMSIPNATLLGVLVLSVELLLRPTAGQVPAVGLGAWLSRMRPHRVRHVMDT